MEDTADGGDRESILAMVTDARLDEFRRVGSALSGRNGPYGNTDTPVRNTAHWLMSLAYLWEKTGRESYLEVLHIFARYLRDEWRGSSGAIQCMIDARFGYINGAIGQAWVIEALVRAAQVLKDETFFHAAVQLFLTQRFIGDVGLWSKVELDGNDDGIDPVFNHQLWFAAAGAQILSYRPQSDVCNYLRIFLARLPINFRIYQSGLIRHFVDAPWLRPLPPRQRARLTVREAKRTVVAPLGLFHDKYRRLRFEEGYHWFNLLGFGIIHNVFPKDPFWRSDSFLRALEYGLNETRVRLACSLPDADNMAVRASHPLNPYLYGYNSPGFEFSSILRLFGLSENRLEEDLWQRSLTLGLDRHSMMFSINTSDPETLTARLYEMTYGFLAKS
ncbi:MAG: hypothetical protein LBJ44_05000 [Propionibacteriaceae bacterium]|jgi:hypothetical protein|nr:hypothetical protein [Propionibacteriaceae bacterium]